MKIKFILLFCFYLAVNQSYAQTIYVSTKGSDHNAGTKNKPLASIAFALKKARALRKEQTSGQPVVIHIFSGTYSLDTPILLTEEDAGTKTSPLVIRGEDGGKTVFTAGKKLPPFKKISDTLWETDITHMKEYGWPFEQLYVNGKRATRSRTPNTGSFYKVRNVIETVISGKDSSRAKEKVLIYPKDLSWMKALTPEDRSNAVITFFHRWDITCKHFTPVSADTALYFTGKKMAPWNPVDNKSIYRVENVKAFLDAPGEWFLDQSGKLLYVPREGETIKNTTASAPVHQKILILKGKTAKPVEYIRFENIVFSETAYKMPSVGNEPSQAAVTVAAAIEADHAGHIVFAHCEIRHTGGYACWFRNDCRFFTMTHCYLHDLGAGGIKIGTPSIPKDNRLLTSHITIDNNIIRSGGYVFPTGTGILILNASDNAITHNEIANFGYTGISAGWVWGYSYSPSKRNNISYNHIHHLGWGILSDMGGVYTLGASEGTAVSNNVIHDIFSRDYGGWGLYTDEGSSGIRMENNLVYHCKSAAFHQHYGKDNIITNNIFALQEKAQLQATRIESHLSFTFTHNIIYFDNGTLLSSNWAGVHLRSDSNCYWDTRTKDIRFGKQSFKEWQQSGKDQHSIIADPLFKNPGKHNFQIRNKTVLNKIHFIPFDYTKTGVYGKKSWLKLARFNEKTAKMFDTIVKENSH